MTKIQKRLLIIFLLLPVIVVAGAFIYTLWQDYFPGEQKLKTTEAKPQQSLRFPVTYSSIIPGWNLLSTLSNDKDSNNYQNIKNAHQEFEQILASWGLWNQDAVYTNSGSSPVTVKSLEIKAVTEPKHLFRSFNKDQVLEAAVSEEYDLSSQKLTLLLFVSPTLLEGDFEGQGGMLSAKINKITLARLYQLTHKDISEEQALPTAENLMLNKLARQQLFYLVRRN
ncbi:hypothetical protein HYW42_04370 [Candidatus Daviesbacteria bacterium]|nr:hypothetical protein [Candidatus Daviesbacteria bacterium]